MRNLLIVSSLAVATSVCCSSSGTTDTQAQARTLPTGGAVIVPAWEGSQVVGYDVHLSSATNGCDRLKRNAEARGATTLIVSLRAQSANGGIAVPTPGDYSVATSPTKATLYANAMYTTTKSASCDAEKSETDRGATGGTVKLSAFTEKGSASGTLDIKFADGGTLTGAFDASFCDIAKAATPPSCE